METKERITFVSNKIPYPPDQDGNNINIFNIIKELSSRKKNTIHFILHSNSYNKSDLTIFKEYVNDLTIKPALNQYTFFLKTPFLKKTRLVGPIFFCNYESGIYESLYKSKKKILYTADSPTFYHSKGNTAKSKIFFIKHVVQETYLFSRFTDVIFVSKDDLHYSKKRVKGKGHVIPIGYDDELLKTVSRFEKEFDFVFSGNFSYPPNYLAAEDFLSNNVPRILANIPEASFYFVGRNPSSRMRELASQFSKVTISGEVESMENELRKSRIFFSNLSKGSGMKNKMLQAMLCKLPIVCTKESWSGFSDELPAGVKITERDEDLNETLIKIYTANQDELNEKGDANCQYFMTHYTWKSIVQKYYIPILIN
ncbi:MAG: glycosyltransferase family 4 protein [Lishizhenia sp.]